MAVALAAVLGLFRVPLPHLLYGGSISLETLPLIVLSLRRGAAVGLAGGTVCGIVNLVTRPIVVHPVQMLLDYPAAFGGLGWAAGWGGPLAAGQIAAHPWSTRVHVLLRIGAGNGLRLFAHFVSGVVFFAAYAPAGQPVWVYSIVYNSSYIVPQVIIHILLLQFMLRVVPVEVR